MQEYKITSELERLRLASDRYEKLRILPPRAFGDLVAENLKTGVPFDTLVDGLPERYKDEATPLTNGQVWGEEKTDSNCHNITGADK